MYFKDNINYKTWFENIIDIIKMNNIVDYLCIDKSKDFYDRNEKDLEILIIEITK